MDHPRKAVARRGPLLGRDLAELTELVESRGEPSYRGRQIYRALYRDRCSEAAQITTLPAALRGALHGEYGVGHPGIQSRCAAADGTVRYLLRLSDGRSIESVFIPERRRDTLCISTQVGCPIDCRFCLTAQLGFERNLSAGEIVGQVLALSRDRGLDTRGRPLNLVMMGMGEPLLNLKAVMKATALLADPQAVGIPQRRITVSTSGIAPKIAEFGAHPVRGKLAVSLNASNDSQRRAVMPLASRYGLKELLAACRRYPLRPWERLTFEYVLLRNVNDADSDAHRVRRLVSGLKCKLNLIALNAGPGIPYGMPGPERVEAFRAIVQRGVPCFVRRPRGQDIFAACGQLKRTESAVGVAAADGAQPR